MKKSSYARVIAANLTDVFFILIFASILLFIVQLFIPLTPLATTLIAVAIFIYYLVHSYLLKKQTFGNWALGLRRFNFSELPEYSGKGNVWCMEDLPNSTYTKRTVVIASIFATYLVILWLYGKYTST